MTPLLLTLMAATFLSAGFTGEGPDRAEQRGEVRFAPDLELPTIDGKRTIRLSQLRGKKLLLIEFASW